MSQDDPFYSRIQGLLQAQNLEWGTQTLNTVSDLVEPIKVELREFAVNKDGEENYDQLDFLGKLADCEELLQWL